MQKPIVAAIARIDDDAWVDIDDDIGARAQVAETLSNGRRLIVRRTLNESDHPTMFEDWRHHAFLTNQPGEALDLDRCHRAHAVVELTIRDLKHDAGMVQQAGRRGSAGARPRRRGRGPAPSRSGRSLPRWRTAPRP